MNLQLRLNAAKGGDIIDLEGVTLPVQSIHGLTFDVPVVIRNGCLSGLTVNGCAGLTFDGLEMIAATDALHGYRFGGCQRITVDGCELHSSKSIPVDQHQVTLIFFDHCADIRFTRNDLSHAWYGVEFRRVERIEIIDNAFHDLRTDGIKGGGMVDGLIEHNRFRDFYGRGTIGTDGDHCDGIQFWTNKSTGRSRNVRILRNRIERGAGRLLQGMLLSGVDGLTVEENLIRGTLWNGLMVAECTDARVNRNTVMGEQGQRSWIRIEPTGGLKEMQGNASEFEHRTAVPDGNERLPLLDPAEIDRRAAMWAETVGAMPVEPQQPLPPQDSLEAIKFDLRELLARLDALSA